MGDFNTHNITLNMTVFFKKKKIKILTTNFTEWNYFLP